jgi:hypothetical protein
MRLDARALKQWFHFQATLNPPLPGNPRVEPLTSRILSRVRSINIATATGWTIGWSGFDSRRGLGIFLFTTVSSPALEPTQPHIQWVPGAISWAWSWPLTSVQCRGQRMRGAVPALPQYVFMAWCSVKQRDNFTFASTFRILISSATNMSNNSWTRFVSEVQMQPFLGLYL